MNSTSRITRLVLLGLGAILFACADSPTGLRTATVIVRLMTPATVASVTVEVSGPGLSPPVVVNIPIGEDSTALDTLMLTAGSARRFVVTAVDTAGVATHRADTTITLQPGANPNLAMRLEPLPSSLGITVTFGGVRLVVPDTSTRELAVGDTAVIQAYAIRANGDTVPADSLTWGSGNPAVADVLQGRVRGVRAGATNASVSFGGVAVRISVFVGEALYFKSCSAIKSAHEQAASAAYTIDPDGMLGPQEPFVAYCEMTVDEGGWTMVLKADGSKSTFNYDAALWTDSSVLNPDDPSPEFTEVKLASYHSVPFTKVLIGMSREDSLRWLVVPVSGRSLLDLIGPGTLVPTSLGRTAWATLLSSPELQPHCNQEGFNAFPPSPYAGVRIGIVSNNEIDCGSPDSFIGIGAKLHPCGVSVGNATLLEEGPKCKPAFAYLLVR